MTGRDEARILEVRGVLNRALPPVFRERLPAILAKYRTLPVQLMVTTQLDRIEEERARQGNFFMPGRGDQPTRFTWKAGGAFDAVVRRFRLDFLRHLGPADMRSEIYFCVSFGENAVEQLGAEIAREVREQDWPASVAAGASAPRTVPAPVQRSAPPAPPPVSTGAFRNPTASGAGNPAARAEKADALALPLAQIIDATSAAAEEADPAPDPTRVELPSTPPARSESRSAAPSPPVSPAAEPSRRAPLPGRGTMPLPGNFYQDWFGFERMPFNNTPDPHFFFPTEKHQEALSRLVYAISERKGFVMISGEVGSGKSTLCRTLLAQLPGNVKTALITHTHIDPEHLVRAIAEDLDLNVTGLSKYDVLQKIYEYLIDQLRTGATVCIIIDEAQNLTPAALEEVRMISNLETEQEKLVQLILLGQPELRDKIRQPEMLQLRQRIAVQYHLRPLNRRETMEYIRHRLKVAAPSEPLDFRPAAMIEAFHYSGGVPRLVNTLCDNALLTAYTREGRQVTAATVREAARDLELPRLGGGIRGFFSSW